MQPTRLFPHTADVLICGAGIAGIAAAYYLATQRGIGDVLLVDERPPLTLTSDKSTEAYRNWWPGPDSAMVQLMNRSIDLMEDLAHRTNNLFNLNRRGYVYATADAARAQDLTRAAERTAELGAGPVRYHRGHPGDPTYVPAPAEGFTGVPPGTDVILDSALIREHFPYLTERTVAVVHARRCGWFSGQVLGMHLLEEARARGVRFLSGRVNSVNVQGGRVQRVQVDLAGETVTVHAGAFVNAAGPFLKEVGQMVGVNLPVFCERHLKVAFADRLNVIPRQAPLLIWADPQFLPWTEEEREVLAMEEDTRWLLGEFPGGAHTRPEGGPGSPMRLMLWAYDAAPVDPVVPVPVSPVFPEVVLRGLTTMLPGLRAYWERPPRPLIDGGYYTKTPENRPLIGPLPVEGAYVIGALSGFGLMAACAAGELLAAHVAGDTLPPYAPSFLLSRYERPDYVATLSRWRESWQL